MTRHTAWALLATIALTLFSGCQATNTSTHEAPLGLRVHYVEIVCNDVAAQCASLAKLHGLSFGPENADFGTARVAEAPDGSLIGVRAPLAEHEQPIVRTYLEVDDIAIAVREAQAAGALIAYGPIQQGDTGTWAIYFLGDAQLGLWQR